MKSNEMNVEILVEGEAEISFRQKAINRLIAEHSDLSKERVDHWLELLND